METTPKRIRKYPIGIQSFEKLRREGYLYVDKTAIIYELVTTGVPYFLSRPRCFGKSLLLSTLKAYFEGKKELFEGLAIAELETEWTVHPVLHLDLNAEKYDLVERLDKQVTSQLMEWETLYGCDAADWTYSIRFKNVIKARPDNRSLSSSTNTINLYLKASTIRSYKTSSVKSLLDSTAYSRVPTPI